MITGNLKWVLSAILMIGAALKILYPNSITDIVLFFELMSESTARIFVYIVGFIELMTGVLLLSKLKLNIIIPIAILLCLVFSINSTFLFAQSNRIYNSVNLQLVDEINLSELDVFEATGLSLDSLGNIIFFDWDRQLIGKTTVSNIGDIIFFAGQEGRGPGEFQNVLTTQIDNGEIYVAAMENRKISKWSMNAEMIKEYTLRTKNVFPIRMAVCNENDYIYVMSRQYWRNGIFHVYNKEGKHIGSFGKIPEREKQHIFYNEGYLECDKSGNLYHSLMYVNKIRKYSPLGELLLEKNVYGGIENKKVLEVDGRWTTLHEDAKTIGGDIHYLEDKLFVAYSGIRPRRFKSIDVYSSDEIKYIHSIEIPIQFRNFAINKDYVVTLDRLKRDDDVWLRVYSYHTNENN